MLVREKGNEEWEDADFFTGYQYEDIIAQKYAEWKFSLDPCEPEDFEITVEVLNDDGKIKLFDVSAEVDIKFTAEERDGKE